MSLQDLLIQIAEETGAPQGSPVVGDGNLQVAYADGLLAYVAQCATVLVSNKGRTPSERSAYLRTLLPLLAARLDAEEPLYPSDASGADFGLALCALGANPFAVADEEDTVVLDSVPWKLKAITTVSGVYERATAAKRVEETKQLQAILLPPPPVELDKTRRVASMPLEALLLLARMLLDTGFNEGLIRRMTGDGEMPPWFSGSMDGATGRATGVANVLVDSRDKLGQDVYWASFQYRRAIVALLRALVATLVARNHAQNDTTRAVLPKPIQWAVHRNRAKSDVLGERGYYFSVVVERPTGHRAPDDSLLPFFNALYKQVGVWPRFVPHDTAVVSADGQLTLRLGALLGAEVGGLLPAAEQATPWLWFQRRRPESSGSPNLWFVFQGAVPADDNGPYSFAVSKEQTQAMVSSALIAARLAVNPNCRHCGVRLPSTATSLLCRDRHHSVQLEEE